MPNREMKVVEKPAEGTASVFVGDPQPKMKGTGNTNYVCGDCGAVLLESMAPGQVAGNLVILCNDCESYNAVA